MDSIQPWLLNAVRDGPLSDIKPSTTHTTDSHHLIPPSLLPLQPIRGKKVQFIRFLSPHSWGANQAVWAEASDRQVTIFVYLSPATMAYFEADQKADTRPLSQLGYPSFALGACRWIWDAPPSNPTPTNSPLRLSNQLCLKVVQDLPRKRFRFGSVASFPYPPVRSGSGSGPGSFKHLPRLASVLSNDERWIRLVKKLEVTKDQRLSASGDVELNMSGDARLAQGSPLYKVMVAVPYTGPSRRVKELKARRRPESQLQMPHSGNTAARPLPDPNVSGPSSENGPTSKKRHLAKQNDHPRLPAAPGSAHASGRIPLPCLAGTAPGPPLQHAQLAAHADTAAPDIRANQPAVSPTRFSPRSDPPATTVFVPYTGPTKRAREAKAHRARVRARAGPVVMNKTTSGRVSAKATL